MESSSADWMDVAALNMMELKKTNTKIKPIKRSGLRIHHSNADCNLNLMEDSGEREIPIACYAVSHAYGTQSQARVAGGDGHGASRSGESHPPQDAYPHE
jgi:hypothetical protein